LFVSQLRNNSHFCKTNPFLELEKTSTYFKYLTAVALFLGILFTHSSAMAQVKDTTLIQLSGVVVAESTLDPMPFTTVFDITARRGVISDYYGYFSFVVHPLDTIYFSFYGYKTSRYVVPDTLTEGSYNIIHIMSEDTLNLPEVTVYPWPSREDFARAFVEMDPYEDALRRAQRELSGENLAFYAARLETDAGASFGNAMNQRNTQIYSTGQLPANNLFNPYAWAKLLQDLKAGNLKRQ
jgi:CarboxypepD_reg-like domain